MTSKPSTHRAAVLQALLVTFLWSTSFVLVKIGLEDIPALTFAGLRYSLAFLCLLPFAIRSLKRNPLRHLNRTDWMRLVLLGLLFYAVTQGAVFLGLSYLSAATVSLMLNFTPVVVAILSIFLLSEQPKRAQWFGVFLSLVGVMIYFNPLDYPASESIGLIILGVGLLAASFSSILGRKVNRAGNINPLLVTTISMGVGALVLLVTGTSAGGLPSLEINHWLIIAWLAVVNTAFAFTLWNHTLRTLTAVESSVINNTMLIQTVILAWIFLGESLTGRELIGLIIAGSGALVVQLRRKPPITRKRSDTANRTSHAEAGDKSG